jgi:DNA polymerase (family 10)
MSTEKQRWPHAAARQVADELVAALAPSCERIEIAGSLRRMKPWVGDIEILYIPRRDEAKLPGEMFAQAEQNLADLAIDTLLLSGVLVKRTNAKGAEMFGEKNKFVRHADSGIPVDLFAVTWEYWFNYLVCRTGGTQTNLAICNAAIKRGWKWNPYGAGFSRRSISPEHGRVEEIVAMTSERNVFEFVGLPWREPEERP